ncbi:probable methyltransferase-like protein 25 [Pectinophora gossypiella]|nr:probable methyltransferase-like protein 25 [Pectinophora gossypiella]
MDSKVTKIRHNLDSIIKYLTPLLPLANCHMVEFLTHNHWEKLLPRPLTESLDSMELNDAVENFWMSLDVKNCTSELDKWIVNARSHCILANNDYCLTREQLSDRIKAWGGEIKPEIKVSEFMNSKKSYEVQTMSGLVASLHEVCGSSCCVEVGGGRGHLLTSLSLSHGAPSLTVDCDETYVRAAADRARKISKQWHAIAKKIHNGTEERVARHTGDLHRFAAAFVTSETDLAGVVRQSFPEYKDDGVTVLLTGLHTCGNLGPDSLRIFTHQPTTAAVFNVPCCYHLLTEQIDEGLFDVFQRNYGGQNGMTGFPMSEHLKGLNLGRNARMLAAQSIDRVLHHRQLPNKSLIYRALLQVIIKQHLPDAVLSEGKLKRIAKCETFQQYFKMADSILKLNIMDNLPEKYLQELHKEMDGQWKKLVLFYLLRLCLAQVIESVILLDRLLYLCENGFDKVFLVKLFDPVLSPRCHSLVAVR